MLGLVKLGLVRFAYLNWSCLRNCLIELVIDCLTEHGDPFIFLVELELYMWENRVMHIGWNCTCGETP